MEPIPSVIAILLCDRIIVEAVTDKKTLIGIFERINVPAPAKIPLAFYARMTDAEGEYKFRVDAVSLRNNSLVARLETSPIQIQSRLGVMELALNLPPVTFPVSGRYEFQLHGNDVFLGHVTVDVAREKGGTEDASS